MSLLKLPQNPETWLLSVPGASMKMSKPHELRETRTRVPEGNNTYDLVNEVFLKWNIISRFAANLAESGGVDIDRDG